MTYTLKCVQRAWVWIRRVILVIQTVGHFSHAFRGSFFSWWYFFLSNFINLLFTSRRDRMTVLDDRQTQSTFTRSNKSNVFARARTHTAFRQIVWHRIDAIARVLWVTLVCFAGIYILHSSRRLIYERRRTNTRTRACRSFQSASISTRTVSWSGRVRSAKLNQYTRFTSNNI